MESMMLNSKSELRELKKKQLKKEALTYNLEQFLVLLPAFIIIVINANSNFLIIPILIGTILDCINSMSKTFWFSTSLLTIPAVIAIYYGSGIALKYINIELPHTDAFSIGTVAFALIVSRFVLSFISNGGMILNYVDLMEKDSSTTTN